MNELCCALVHDVFEVDIMSKFPQLDNLVVPV